MRPRCTRSARDLPSRHPKYLWRRKPELARARVLSATLLAQLPSSGLPAGHVRPACDRCPLESPLVYPRPDAPRQAPAGPREDGAGGRAARAQARTGPPGPHIPRSAPALALARGRARRRGLFGATCRKSHRMRPRCGARLHSLRPLVRRCLRHGRGGGLRPGIEDSPPKGHDLEVARAPTILGRLRYAVVYVPHHSGTTAIPKRLAGEGATGADVEEEAQV